MSVAVGVGELLHFGAIVLAVSIAYVGLDRVSDERNQFKKALTEAGEKAKAILLQFDCLDGKDGGDVKKIAELISGIGSSGTVIKFKTLMKISGATDVTGDAIKVVNLKEGPRTIVVTWMDIWNVWRCHTPGLSYFRSDSDRLVVGFIACAGTIAYALTTAGAIWQIEFFQSAVWIQPLFVFYVVCIVWIFATVGCSFKLANLKQHVDHCAAAVQDRLKNVLGDKMKDSLPKSVAPTIPTARMPSAKPTPPQAFRPVVTASGMLLRNAEEAFAFLNTLPFEKRRTRDVVTATRSLRLLVVSRDPEMIPQARDDLMRALRAIGEL
jgi:hypothetical protein